MGNYSRAIKQSLVIPIRDEEHNITPLVRRIHSALSEHNFTEIIFVDDSNHTRGATAVASIRAALCDGTCQHVRIRHIHRTGALRYGGLSGAVTDGMAAAESDVVVVMDGDLQHPPEAIPRMLKRLAEKDIVVASRYVRGGSSEGLDGPIRHLVSRGSTTLAKALFPIKLRGVSDPMTGFFALRRSAIYLARLQPQGFKILVEILLAHPDIRRGEVPFGFARRHAGESKGDLSQGVQFFSQLLRHRLFPNRTDRAYYEPESAI